MSVLINIFCENSRIQNNVQVSVALDSGALSPMESTSNRIYKGITNFFGRFDPRAQLFKNSKTINPFACTNPVTSGLPVVIETIARVTIPP